MSALYTALVEGNSREELAIMVCELRDAINASLRIYAAHRRLSGETIDQMRRAVDHVDRR